ncbi:hypothetical protein [Bacillus sp. UMB0728]|uniref:hypothetical protein n=1 Tax=Bacillus sp. UMB0728 TaxID=2066052 RepID=UPI001C60B33F|nr:hypothetical protein [Bacillus sp. UMB0728]
MVGKKQNFIGSPSSVGEQGNWQLKPYTPKKIVKELNEYMEHEKPELPIKEIELAELDFKAFYNIEKYLFDTVHERFKDQGHLSAPDFFLIVIWKSNRSKSKIAKRLLEMGYSSIQEAVKSITAEVNKLNDSKQRLKFLMANCELRLPMASAILTVLFPESFTVYDIRVCDVLQEMGYHFHSLTDRKFSEGLWDDYTAYINAVSVTAPEKYSLRDKDRYLWGKSFYEQLVTDISNNFNVCNEGE